VAEGYDGGVAVHERCGSFHALSRYRTITKIRTVEKVMSAIDDATDGWDGEEIGTSDVSAYFNRAAEYLTSLSRIKQLSGLDEANELHNKESLVDKSFKTT